MTPPAPLTPGPAPAPHLCPVTAETDRDAVTADAAHQRKPLPAQPGRHRATSGSVGCCSIDAGDAVVLLRRWSQDMGSPSHLRRLVTHYRDWPAVALVLGELTSAELSRPGRSAQ